MKSSTNGCNDCLLALTRKTLTSSMFMQQDDFIYWLFSWAEEESRSFLRLRVFPAENIIKLDYINITLSMGSLCFSVWNKYNDGTWLLMSSCIAFCAFLSRRAKSLKASSCLCLHRWGAGVAEKRVKVWSGNRVAMKKVEARERHCRKDSRTHESRRITS